MWLQILAMPLGLGAARIADLNDARLEFDRVIPESLAFLRQAGLEGLVADCRNHHTIESRP